MRFTASWKLRFIVKIITTTFIRHIHFLYRLSPRRSEGHNFIVLLSKDVFTEAVKLILKFEIGIVLFAKLYTFVTDGSFDIFKPILP